MPTLGEKPKSNESRDAVHVAVAPTVAASRLAPGDWVALTFQGTAVHSTPEAGVGVVDPFLKESLLPGDRFWLFMRPNTVSGLRHDWDHPAFPAKPNLISPWVSEKWLTEWGEAHGLEDYEYTIEVLDGHVNKGDAGIDVENLPPEIWDHYEAATGRTVPPHRRNSELADGGCRSC